MVKIIQKVREKYWEIQKVISSRAWFRSTDLWVMGPARFHCATLLRDIIVEIAGYILFTNKLLVIFITKQKYLNYNLMSHLFNTP